VNNRTLGSTNTQPGMMPESVGILGLPNRCHVVTREWVRAVRRLQY
jgi:hypothetical protein